MNNYLLKEEFIASDMRLIMCKKHEIAYINPLQDELEQYIAHHLNSQNQTPLVISLSGKKGCGRTYLFSQLAFGIGCNLIILDNDFTAPISEIVLTARANSAVVCVQNPSEQTLSQLSNAVGIVFALCNGQEYLKDSHNYYSIQKPLPSLDSENRRLLVADLFKDIPLKSGINIADEIWLQSLNIGELVAVAHSLTAQTCTGKPVGRAQLDSLQKAHASLEISGAAVLACKGNLDSVILPEPLHSQLRELCAFIPHRQTVFNTWGFAEKVPWGRGISVLFYGAPGTGKTLAAAVLANEVGSPLLRVDLAQLTSKFIGETQKNIGKIFDDAAKTDCILFFDEADAVFAKRTESADAQDKYANAETAYLLQRMESYDGICILATNLLQNFDEAFRRRIGYMLHFPFPDVVQRQRIWQGIFPANAPLDYIDFALLAQQLELSGACIKSCAVHAAYLAAANGTNITMQYILAGAKNEYAKLGKSLPQQSVQLLSI